MTSPALESVRSETPDGAEIRVLIDKPQGATRLSLAEALPIPTGCRFRVENTGSSDLVFLCRAAVAGAGRSVGLAGRVLTETQNSAILSNGWRRPTARRFSEYVIKTRE